MPVLPSISNYQFIHRVNKPVVKQANAISLTRHSSALQWPPPPAISVEHEDEAAVLPVGLLPLTDVPDPPGKTLCRSEPPDGLALAEFKSFDLFERAEAAPDETDETYCPKG
jgi:hypothetical protein